MPAASIASASGWAGPCARPLGNGYTKYSYEIRENNLKVLKSGVLDVSSGAAVLETTLDHPGMLYARLVLHRRARTGHAAHAHRNWTR